MKTEKLSSEQGFVFGNIERAKQMIEQLRDLGFRPYLDNRGALLIADVLGNRRDVFRYAPTVFGDLAAGLAENPRLLDPYRRNENGDQ
jgi:hypothetical protein